MRRADNLIRFMCRLSINLGASKSWNPKGLSRPVMGLLYRYIIIYVYCYFIYMTITIYRIIIYVIYVASENHANHTNRCVNVAAVGTNNYRCGSRG